MASLDQVVHFYPSRKNYNLEKEIRDWIERYQGRRKDLFEFI